MRGLIFSAFFLCLRSPRLGTCPSNQYSHQVRGQHSLGSHYLNLRTLSIAHRREERREDLAPQMQNYKVTADATECSLQACLLPRLLLCSELGKYCQVRIMCLCSGPDSRGSPGERRTENPGLLRPCVFPSCLLNRNAQASPANVLRHCGDSEFERFKLV